MGEAVKCKYNIGAQGPGAFFSGKFFGILLCQRCNLLQNFFIQMLKACRGEARPFGLGGEGELGC